MADEGLSFFGGLAPAFADALENSLARHRAEALEDRKMNMMEQQFLMDKERMQAALEQLRMQSEAFQQDRQRLNTPMTIPAPFQDVAMGGDAGPMNQVPFHQYEQIMPGLQAAFAANMQKQQLDLERQQAEQMNQARTQGLGMQGAELALAQQKYQTDLDLQRQMMLNQLFTPSESWNPANLIEGMAGSPMGFEPEMLGPAVQGASNVMGQRQRAEDFNRLEYAIAAAQRMGFSPEQMMALVQSRLPQQMAPDMLQQYQGSPLISPFLPAQPQRQETLLGGGGFNLDIPQVNPAQAGWPTVPMQPAQQDPNFLRHKILSRGRIQR